MAATERTYLTRPNDPPHYVEFAGILRNRRNRIRQFQCCVCAFLLALFVMSIVVTISYSISHAAANNLTSPENFTNPTINLLKFSRPSLNSDPLNPNSTSLTERETKEGIQAGNEEIQKRRISDTYTKPLPSPSPNYRHQFAVSTSLQAGALALAGVGEIAATKKIEESRLLHGKPSSMGSYFDGGWAPHGSCKEFTKISCKRSKYRTYDGTCNNPRQWGAAMTPYRRVLPPAYADKINSPRRSAFGKALPSAREVSLKVHPPSPSSNPAFTVMLAVFGQFLDHDITATAISQGKNGSSLSCCSPYINHPECFPVEVGHGDPVYDIGKSSCMEFVRSAPAPQCKIGPREQLNQVTSFIDGSTIYGSDKSTAYSLREFHGGRLKMQVTSDNRTLLPKSFNFNDGCNRKQEWKRGRYCFAAGDKRANENLHLTTMHILWSRQHNRLADKLSELNPSWNDETVFQEARRIVGAQLQHIAYNEFIPIVLGQTVTNSRNLKPLKSGYRKMNTTVNPALVNNFAASAFRFAHTLLPGLMKVTDADKGTTNYIELHRMLFNPYSLYGEKGIAKSVTMATSNVIQKTSTHVTSQLTSHLFEDPAANKTLPCGLDLVSLNIQRGRDHGLPGYSKWREYCGLKKPNRFSDLKDDLDPDAVDAISKLYSRVDDVDLYTGALAEVSKSDSIVGPTFTCLLGEQFERSQQGDSFWYENSDQPGSFTEEQLIELRKTSLAKLICDCSDGISEIQAEVMKSEGVDNPIISCEDIPEPSLEAWKEIPTLTADEPDKENWLAFKNNINKTIQNIADFIKRNDPSNLPSNFNDNLGFQKELNDSFDDLRNELQGLRPESFDFDDVDPVDSDLNDPVDSDLNDLVDSELNDPNLLTNLMIFMNNSLEDANNSLVGKKPFDDWEAFKTNIIITLNTDLLKDHQDLLSFKKKIKLEVDKIKDEVADMKKQIADLKKNPKMQKIIDRDWNDLKTDVVESVSQVVNVIEDNLPLSDDPNRNSYMQRVKEEFSNFCNRMIDKNLTNQDANDMNLSQWYSTKRNIVKSLNDTIMNIDNKPDLSIYEDQIKNKYSNIHDNLTINHKSKRENSEWFNFKHDLYVTFKQILRNVKNNAPPPGDPSWSNYKTKIFDMFSNFRNNIPLKNKVLLKVSEEGDVFDWTNFRADFNKSLCDFMDDEKSVNDSKWDEFEKNFNKSINDSRYRMSVLKLNFAESLNSDWTTFRKDLKEAIKNVVQYIKDNAPPHGSPDWIEFRKEIRKRFKDLRKEFNLRKSEILENMSEMRDLKNSSRNSAYRLFESSYQKGTTFDWRDLKSDINKTVNYMMKRKSKQCWTCDSKCLKFKNYVNNSILDFKNNVSDWSSKGHKKQLLLLTNDWSDFSKEINTSLADALKNLENERISKNQDWMDLRDTIKNNVAELKEEIAEIKQEWQLKIKQTTMHVSDLKNLEENTNKSFTDLKNRVKNLETEPIRFNVTDEDWKSFKDSVNQTVNDYIKSITQNDSSEWMKFKEFVNQSLSDLKKEITDLKNNIEEASKTIVEINNPTLSFTNKKWKKRRNNQTINDILDGMKNTTLTNSSLNELKAALVRTRDQFLTLSYYQLQTDSNDSEWRKYEDSVKNNFKELDEAIKNRNKDVVNGSKSSALIFAPTIKNIWISCVLFLFKP